MASSYFFNAKARLACSTEPSSVTADGTASVVDLHAICELIDCPEFTQNVYFFLHSRSHSGRESGMLQGYVERSASGGLVVKVSRCQKFTVRERKDKA